MRMVGFHNTSNVNAQNILESGFTYKENRKHYLGQGIYFFDDLHVALDNVSMMEELEEPVVVSADIEANDEEILNLDNNDNLTKFRVYVNNSIREMKEQGIKLSVDAKEKDAYIVYRCYFFDLYKRENNIGVIVKTFPKDSPPYGQKVAEFNFFGLPYLEKYICVSSDEYIKNKRVIKKEDWLIC